MFSSISFSWFRKPLYDARVLRPVEAAFPQLDFTEIKHTWWQVRTWPASPSSVFLIMDTLPSELLSNIASFLSLSDLSSFRLACRRFTYASLHLLLQHLCVLDTLDDLEELFSCLSLDDKSRYTESLTLLHGRWPVCDFQRWATHPLQLNESLPQTASSPKWTDAFQRYRLFVENEARRTTHDDLTRLKKVLELFPRLRQLTVSHLHTKGWRPVGPQQYIHLREQIWMSPCISDSESLGAIAQSVLTLLPTLSSVQHLAIDGRLNLSSITDITPIIQITSLKMKAVQLASWDRERFLSVIHMFPSLRELALGFTSTEVLVPVDKISLPFLKRLSLHRLYVSETALLRVLERNPQVSLHLSDATLVRGHWDTFCHRARRMGKGADITLEGYMNGLDPTCVHLSIEGDRKYRLLRFLENGEAQWPFRARWIAPRVFYV
ncbi:Putative F-box domain-containing protein [Colletotrichum destructivum]|uniref:F-box domain-containing protein n=1 Tax=Colletotrichum destructivum TaxID=34406 RepID=A0AAX4J228_9PEZI|nr:Putative F-box domain-containing protein [Colletotrichum destructivum]